MKTQDVTGKAGDVAYTGVITIFETMKEYRNWLKDDRNEADVDGACLKAVNDYEGRRQRQNLRAEHNPSRATGAREVGKLVTEVLKSGNVTPDELKAAIAALG